MANPIVSTDWLYEHLEAPDIVVVHAILEFERTLEYLQSEYLETRIAGARLFDIDDIADETSDLPHMLPSAAKFSARMRKMGIGDGQRIVVYDTSGNFCASRVWWMFRSFGIDDVVVLDGGLPKWLAEGKPVVSGPPAPRGERHFTARFRSMNVRDMDDVRAALKAGSDQVVDARSSARFSGEEKETREGLRSGHMPGSFNVYYNDVLNDDKTLKSRDEIIAVFDKAGVDLSKPIITTCGSGVTAAILSLALEIVGHNDAAVYDGSWTQWAAIDENAVEQG